MFAALNRIWIGEGGPRAVAVAPDRALSKGRPAFLSEETLAEELWSLLEPRCEDFARNGIELKRTDYVSFNLDHENFSVMAFCYFSSITVCGGPRLEGFPIRFAPPVRELTRNTVWADEAMGHIDTNIQVLRDRTS